MRSQTDQRQQREVASPCRLSSRGFRVRNAERWRAGSVFLTQSCREIGKLRSLKSAALWATLTLVVFCCAPDHVFAASPNGAANPPEQTTPQGQDPPGTDNGEPTAPMVEHKGVIEPPPTGDEGINTNVPNPNAGHEGEVIPPPGTPVGDPNVEPR